MNQNELMHYGVKGMKWGVRRRIGQKARAAADLERKSNTYAKAVNRSLKWHSKKHSNATYVLEKTKNELVAQLSKKDIEQGKDFFRRYLL